ncbi:hypothetical protein ACP70R_046583 [Stipagrostis hirtigluma subsp. patula]
MSSPPNVVEATPPASGPAPVWSELQQDLLVGIFSQLELPDLVYAGAVCMPWRLSYLAVRRFGLCSPNQSPYLVYSSGDRDTNTATLHNLSTDKKYHCSLPDPPFRSRYVIGASHGWLVTNDEQCNLHLVNPVTRDQISLPPAPTMTGLSPCFTGDGILSGYYIDALDLKHKRNIPRDPPVFYETEFARLYLYKKAILTADPSRGDFTVLLIHRPTEHLSFVRSGDTKWTWIDANEHCRLYKDFFYNKDDRLFYAIQGMGGIHTIELSGPSPVVNVIFKPVSSFVIGTRYILRAPWGDILYVFRNYGPLPPEALRELDIEESEEDDSEVDEIVVHKVDLAKQKIRKMKHLQGHALFIGFNRTFMLHAKDFPNLRPNCVYLSDDNTSSIFCNPLSGRKLSCLKLDDGTVTDMSFSDSLLHWPPPIWFRPSC